MADVAQYGCGHQDDGLRRDARCTQPDQRGQCDGVDADRYEIDTLESRQIAKHVSADPEYESAVQHESNKYPDNMRHREVDQGSEDRSD